MSDTIKGCKTPKEIDILYRSYVTRKQNIIKRLIEDEDDHMMQLRCRSLHDLFIKIDVCKIILNIE